MSDFDVIAIGASLGGLCAVETLLEVLPSHWPNAIVIAQHRKADPDSRLPELLQEHCKLPLCEPEDKQPLQPGHVYLAPANYHLLVEHGSLSLSVDPPVWFARPSIDVLLESVAYAYGPRATAIVLTGSNNDGALGAAAVKRFGGRVIVQDPETAERGDAPRAVLEATAVDAVLELSAIAQLLLQVEHRTA